MWLNIQLSHGCLWDTERMSMLFFPIGSMYGIFAYIYHKIQPNVGKYTSPMDAYGFDFCCAPAPFPSPLCM